MAQMRLVFCVLILLLICLFRISSLYIDIDMVVLITEMRSAKEETIDNAVAVQRP